MYFIGKLWTKGILWQQQIWCLNFEWQKTTYNNLQENVLIMAFFDATVFSGFLAFDLNTYSHSKNIFILEPILGH